MQLIAQPNLNTSALNQVIRVSVQTNNLKEIHIFTYMKILYLSGNKCIHLLLNK